MKSLLAVSSAMVLALGGAAFAQSQTSQPHSSQPYSSQTRSDHAQPGMSGSMGQAETHRPSASSAEHQVSAEQVKQAQNELKRQGLYKGTIDGIIGPQTKSAIAEFQKKQGLQQTSSLDQQTMERLATATESSGSSTMPSSGGQTTGGGSSSTMPSHGSAQGVGSDSGSTMPSPSAPAQPPAH